MQTITTKTNHKIKLYESIYDLPMKRSQAFNKFFTMDAEIGSNIEDVGKHFSKLNMFLGAGKDMNTEAQRESYNLYYHFFLMLDNINPKYLSFACMVKEIDGVVYDDLTESGLGEVTKKLEEIELTEGEIRDFITDVKKNLMPNVN